MCTEQGFVVSFPVPLHHPTSVLGLHDLCCLPSAPREFNHTASLHLEPSLFSILAWIYTLTSWIFNIPPPHTQRDNSSASPARTADPSNTWINVYPQLSSVLSNYQQLSPCVGTHSNTTAWLTALLWFCFSKLSPLVMQAQGQGGNAEQLGSVTGGCFSPSPVCSLVIHGESSPQHKPCLQLSHQQ